MKGSRRATGRNLAEDAAAQTEFLLDDEMQQIVRHPGVVAWRWIHVECYVSRPEDRNAIATLACATELDFHTRDLPICRCAVMTLTRATDAELQLGTRISIQADENSLLGESCYRASLQGFVISGMA
jgi:hypothetical protein